MNFSVLQKLQLLSSLGVRVATAGSGTYTAKVTGWHRVRTQGAGAGGGGARALSGTPVVRSGGGGAGEYAECLHFLIAGTAYNYTVGAGGAGGNGTTPANGTDGGNTTFTGPVFTQTSLGGKGSPAVLSSVATDGAGGAGGRRDGNGASSASAVQQGPNCWGGANGAAANDAGTAFAGCFNAAVSTSRAGSGAPSFFASGAQGPNAVGPGANGVRGGGGSGAWSASTTGQPGGNGGVGELHVEYVGTI
jgi:hypothetical protein